MSALLQNRKAVVGLAILGLFAVAVTWCVNPSKSAAVSVSALPGSRLT